MYQIVVRCKRQPDTHAKIIRLRKAGGEPFGLEEVEIFARLLDGTSPFFCHRPGPDSTIGKCATCGGELESTVEERVEDAEHEEQKRAVAGEL